MITNSIRVNGINVYVEDGILLVVNGVVIPKKYLVGDIGYGKINLTNNILKIGDNRIEIGREILVNGHRLDIIKNGYIDVEDSRDIIVNHDLPDTDETKIITNMWSGKYKTNLTREELLKEILKNKRTNHGNKLSKSILKKLSYEDLLRLDTFENHQIPDEMLSAKANLVLTKSKSFRDYAKYFLAGAGILAALGVGEMFLPGSSFATYAGITLALSGASLVGAGVSIYKQHQIVRKELDKALVFIPTKIKEIDAKNNERENNKTHTIETEKLLTKLANSSPSNESLAEEELER